MGNLKDRLLRTESLAAIAAVVLLVTGRADTLEEALAMALPLTALIVGRSVVKSRGLR